MRDIKFRGKRLDNGEWVYGCLGEWIEGSTVQPCIDRIDTETYDGEDVFIPYYAKVDPDTVGQFTGLKDRNGREIWEGDLIEHGDEVSQVFFDTENSCFDFKASNDPFAAQFSCDYEIIGNIHDNPELLK